MSDRRILLLTLCSNTKAPGGSELVADRTSVLKALTKPVAGRIRSARQIIYRLIQSGAVTRAGIRLIDQPYNHDLIDGPDLGMSGHGGSYLPAAERYAGRFWGELGDKRLDVIAGAPFRLLIVSGLYGLLAPEEPIQRYSCHVLDHSQIASTWRSQQLLTDALSGYTEQNGITDIVDLLGEDAYRLLIEWNVLQRSVRVIHCYGAQNAGPDSLRALGALAAELAGMNATQVAEALDEPGRDTPYERVLFSSAPEAPFGAPRELTQGKLWLDSPDQLSRMRRNIIRMLHRRENGIKNSYQLVARIHHHQRIGLDPKLAQKMLAIEALRRQVEYDSYHPTVTEMMRAIEQYASLEQWAAKKLGITDFEKI